MSGWTDADALRLRGLHLIARAALRVRPPLRAKALVDWVAHMLPPLRSADHVQSAVGALFPSGTCLSRAVTIAAALPGAEVVIGVNVWNAARPSAHAWLEIDGVRVDTTPGSSQFPDELARFPRRPMSDHRRSP